MGKNKMILKPIITVLFVLFLVVHMANNISFEENRRKVPGVSPGKMVVFSEEMTKAMRVFKVDATDQYIFFGYSTIGVVAAYDWDGEYQFSMAFYNDTNGTLEMRCDQGLLYVSDFAGYELVLSGKTHIMTYEPSQNKHSSAWFRENANVPFYIDNGAIYDEYGKFIMEIPGQFW